MNYRVYDVFGAASHMTRCVTSADGFAGAQSLQSYTKNAIIKMRFWCGRRQTRGAHDIPVDGGGGVMWITHLIHFSMCSSAATIRLCSNLPDRMSVAQHTHTR